MVATRKTPKVDEADDVENVEVGLFLIPIYLVLGLEMISRFFGVWEFGHMQCQSDLHSIAL